jgi:adenylate kinase
MNVRFGVMIVGAAGVGKTLIYKILKKTMKTMI